MAQRQRGEDGETGTSPNPRLLRVSPVRLAGCTYSLWKGLLKKHLKKHFDKQAATFPAP